MQTLYNQQLQYVFNRPISNPAWYWQAHDEENPFGEEEDAMTAFLFYEQLCQQPGLDLATFTDAQVGQGLTFLFDGSVSNLTHGFKKAPVPVKRKVAALLALSTLFKEVLAPRCAPVLSAYAQEASPPLSYICYMFWDVTPLATWIKYEGMEPISADTMHHYQNSKDEMQVYYRAIASVMESCLYLDNPACVESGLHGLGHLVVLQSGIAVPIIDRFLKNAKKQDARLLGYAKSARTGMIL